MKTKFILLLLVALLIFACNTEIEEVKETVDLAAIEKTIEAVADEYYENAKTMDINAVDSLYHENGLFMGTAPDEYWTKDSIMSLYRKMAEDTSLNFDFKIDKRVINVAPDGMSALVTEQFYHNMICGDLVYVRSVKRFINVNGSWKIDYLNWALVPTNEDLYFIYKTLKAKAE